MDKKWLDESRLKPIFHRVQYDCLQHQKDKKCSECFYYNDKGPYEHHDCIFYRIGMGRPDMWDIFNNKENNYMDDTRTEVVKLIWDICKISPEHGNAVMDIIGEEAYERIMEEANNDN